MRKISDARINMQRTTAQFYTDNQPTFDTVPAITENFVTYKSNLTALEAALPDALNDPSVAALIANKLKMDLAKATEKVALGAVVYADVIKDANLLQIMSVRASTLMDEKKDRLPTICQQVYDEANRLKAELEAYNVTGADLEALREAIPAYSAAANSPRLSHGNRKAATETVVTTLRLNNELLKSRLDPLVQTLTISHPALVVGWKNARKLVNQPTRRTSLLLTVLGPDGMPLADASVKLVKDAVEYKGTTDEAGQCSFEPILFGELALSVVATGYQPYSLPKLKLKRSEENTIEVRLQPQS